MDSEDIDNTTGVFVLFFNNYFIVAKCPGMTGTVPEFLHLSRTCPG